MEGLKKVGVLEYYIQNKEIKMEKFKTHIERYAALSKRKNIWKMAGRPKWLTIKLNDYILSQMNLKKEDVLVDIGCGNGYLVQKASKKVSKAIGILPTKEETERVRKYHKKK